MWLGAGVLGERKIRLSYLDRGRERGRTAEGSMASRRDSSNCVARCGRRNRHRLDVLESDPVTVSGLKVRAVVRCVPWAPAVVLVAIACAGCGSVQSVTDVTNIGRDQFVAARQRMAADGARPVIVAVAKSAFVVVQPGTLRMAADVVLSRTLPAEGPPPPLPHAAGTKIAPLSDYFTIAIHPAGGSVGVVGGLWRPALQLVFPLPMDARGLASAELLVCTYTPVETLHAFGGIEEAWQPIGETAPDAILPQGSRAAFYVMGRGTQREVRILTGHAGIFAVFRKTAIAR